MIYVMKPVKISTASQHDLLLDWTSLTTACSSQMAKQQPLNISQFKWRVSANHLQSNEPNTIMASPMTTTDIDKLPTASGSRHLTSIHKTTPSALSPVVGGVVSKPASRRTHRGVSGGRTLVNSKYKWRRRLSSSGMNCALSHIMIMYTACNVERYQYLFSYSRIKEGSADSHFTLGGAEQV